MNPAKMLWTALLLSLSACVSPVTEGLDAYEDADYAAAQAAWSIGADQGDLDATFLLGTLYENGLGVQKSDVRAERYYREAAEKGHTEAAVNLGRILLLHNAANEAADWFRVAAEDGSVAGAYNLGMLYLTGTDVPAQSEAALDWLTRAARREH